MADERIKVILDVDAEVSKAKGNISSLSKIFDGVGGSKGNQLRELLSDISAEYEKITNESGKKINKVGDFTKAEKSSERLDQLLRRLDKEIGNISKSSKSDLSKFFPTDIADKVKKASDAIKTYNSILENSGKKKGAIGTATNEYEKQEKAIKKAAEALKDLQNIKQGNSTKQVVNEKQKSDAQTDWETAKKKVIEYNNAVTEAQRKVEQFKKSRPDLVEKNTLNYSKYYKPLRDELEEAKAALASARTEAKNFQRVFDNMVVVTDLDTDIKTAEESLQKAKNAAIQLKTNLDNVTATELSKAFDEAKKKLEGISDIDLSEITNIDDLNNLLQRFINEGVQGLEDGLRKAGVEIKNLGNANVEIGGKIRSTTADFEAQNRALEDINGIKNRILQFFSLTNAMQLGRQAIRQTIETVKELDKSMTETAVVTDFSVGDMWDQLPEYTDMAREYGVAIKGVYDASTLYYQQGLNQEQTMQMTGETLKMARIAGLEYADATDLMTAALRGFNMELNENNATRINDVYSELAAITAADTEEIATAMTKTASIASSANMEFETTAALLSQIIETTREPAETAGTAMKTIIARFTEMKKATSDIINVDGEEVSVNKVEAALKSAGVALRDANGEFKDLDDVFLELSSKWDSLDVMTQRYIATMAAGSRQQSRFIAMMQNYDRTMELVDAAYNSAGSSSEQFGKTQDSLETKIANLETAWQEFLMGISNSDAIKGIIDILTKLLNIVNDATTGISGFSTFISRIFVVIGGLSLGKSIFNKMFSGIGSELFKHGEESGAQISNGISKGFASNIKNLSKEIPNKIASIFKTKTEVPKIPIDFDWGETGKINAKSFVKTIETLLPADQLQKSIPDVGQMVTQSIQSAIETHGLADEGQNWAEQFGNAFVQKVRDEGKNMQAAIAEIEAEFRHEIEESKAASKTTTTKKGNKVITTKITEKDQIENDKKDKLVSDLDSSGLQILKETQEVTEKTQANIIGIGTALTTASMSANLVTKALQESGAVSEKTSSTISNFTNGLTTAGSLMVALKAAQTAFNIEANLNPYIAIAAALIGTLTIIGSLIKQNAENEKKANEATLESATKAKEKTKKLEELIAKQKELAEAYEKTGENEEELIAIGEDIKKALKEEGVEVQNLSNDYKALAEAANESLEARYKENISIQNNAQNAAMTLAASEGKFAAGGAGFIEKGSQFEMNLGNKDSYANLASLINQMKDSYGLGHLMISQDTIDNNLKVTGISSEDQRFQFGRMMEQVMSQYVSGYLQDHDYSGSDSTAYAGYSEWFSSVSSYYNQYNEAAELAKENAKKSVASSIQSTYGEQKFSNVEEYMSTLNTLISKYKGDDRLSDFTDKEKETIISDALGEVSASAKTYAKALNKFNQKLTGNTTDLWSDYLSGLTENELSLLGTIDLTVDEDTLIVDVKKALAEEKYKIAIGGDLLLGEDITSYIEKLMSEDGATLEDKMAIGVALSQNPGMSYYAERWNAVSQQNTASQLQFFQDAYSSAQALSSYNRTALRDSLVSDLIVTDDEANYATDLKNTTEEYRKIANAARQSAIWNLEDVTDYTNERNAKYQEAKDKSSNKILGAIAETTGGALMTVGGTAITAIGGVATAAGITPIGVPLLAEGGSLTVTGAGLTADGIRKIVQHDPEKDAEEAVGATQTQIDTALNNYNQYLAEYETNKEKYYDSKAQLDSTGIAQYGIQLFNKEEIKNGSATVEETIKRGEEQRKYLQQYAALKYNSSDYDMEQRSQEQLFGLSDEKKGTVVMTNHELLQYVERQKLNFNDLAQVEEYVKKLDYSAANEGMLLKSIESERNRRNIIKAAGIDIEHWDGISETEQETIDNKIKELKEKIKIEGDVNLNTSDALSAANTLQDTLEGLEDIQIEIEIAELDSAINSLEILSAQMQNLNAATSLIDEETFQVDASAFQELMKIYPDLLEGHKVLSDGMIQLNQQVVQDIVNGVKQTATETDRASIESKKTQLKEQKIVLENMLKGKDIEKNAANIAAKSIALTANKQAQDQSDAAETAANNTGEASAQATTEVVANMAKIGLATDALGAKIDALNGAFRGGSYADAAGAITLTGADGKTITAEQALSQTGVHIDFSVSGELPDEKIISDRYATNQGYFAAYEDYKQKKEGKGEVESFDVWMSQQNQEGLSDEQKAEAISFYNLINDTISDLDTQYNELSILESGLNTQQNNLGTYKGDNTTGDGSGGGSGDKLDFEKESDRIKAKIDELDSAIEDLADNDIVDMRMVNELINQKIALQKQYKKALEQELGLLSKSTDEIWSQVKKAGNDKYIQYDEETGMYGYTDAYYAEFYEDGLPIDSEQMQKIQEQASQLNRINSDQLANQVAIKELVDNLVENQAENYNAERVLKGRERRQTEADQEEELIGMLPEEIQPFFQALNTAEDAYLEMQEIQANKVLAENLQQQLDASYAGVPDYIKENMTFDEYSGYGIDLAKINQIEDKEAREEMLTAVQENAKILNEQYFDPLYDVKEQLSGGKLQRAILNTGKSLQELAKEISDGDIDTGLKKINTGFKALDDALNSFIKNLEDNEAIENILSTKVLPSLNLDEEQATKLISNPKLQKALQGNVPLQNFVLQAIGTEGIDLGSILGAAFGQTGGLLEQIGGFLNFDMMKILGDGGGLIEQGKQIVEQIVGKIAEITGALIDAWTNREDILYNFLNVLEKYLHDYEVMQRYSTQLEKGRMASVDDIRQNWEQQWQSLQDQLEMQQERIETRQDQLDRSRWNPFQLISGWDPTSDSLYENRGVKMAFDLLISAIGMLPMGLGTFGGQLNQLYEDYDKRVQEAYEDRLAAEMAILDIEDQRLELVKIGAEEATEFEQKVLDALVQKEQEQIEELSRLNDAITDANSKLISTLQKNLDQIRQDRENEKKEEELGEKERRLAYLRQDTSGANMMEIKKLEEELEEGHEDYTDTLIDQKISELEKQNEAAAEQRQQQIDLLQAQLDWSQKYGLYWDAIYGMLYTIDENGNAVLNPENFDLDGNIRENSQLAQMLGTFSDRLGMSVWSSVLDNEEAKRLGRYYGAFIGNNGVSGEWADYWALLNPGADDPDYATPMPEIPDGIWGVLYRIETSIGKYFGSSNMGLWNAGERLEVGLKNILGDVFNIEEWANATAKGFHREDVIGKNTLTLMNGWNKLSEGLLGIADFGNKTSQSLTNRAGYNRHQNNGDNNISNYFNIGTVGENISLDDMVDKVSSALREVFSAGTNIVHHGR